MRFKKFFKSCFVDFSNGLFALRNRRILIIENKTTKNNFGYQAFNKYSADWLNIACIFEI